MFGAIKGFIAIIAVMAVAIIGLLILNVVQLQRGNTPQTIVITATPQPGTVAQAAATILPTPIAQVSQPAGTPTAAAQPSATPAVVATPTLAASLTPALTATTAPTATPQATPTPVAKPGAVLYQADWSSGMNGWTGPPSWKAVGGMLVNDGSDPGAGPWIAAPIKSDGFKDYAVEWAMQVLRVSTGQGCNDGSAGIVGRADAQGFYWAGEYYSYGFGFTPSARVSAVPSGKQYTCNDLYYPNDNEVARAS